MTSLPLNTTSPRGWKRYPKYRDSGVMGLGEVPEKWIINKIKYASYVKGRIGWQGLRSDEFIDEGPYLVTGTDFIDGKVNWETCYHVSEVRYDEDRYIQLRNYDLLITKDGSIGKTAIVDNLLDKATLNSGIFLTRCIDKTYTTNYLNYLLNSDVFSSFIDFKKSGTTINHLYQNVFVDFSYPSPPLPEQTAITNFLDLETARIDALIAKKERQTELLHENRAALISHAVTRGLDPNAKMKDSGVEWIGEVPEHWAVIKFRRYCRVLQGLQIAQVDRFSEPGDNRFEYITIQSIHAGDTNQKKEYIGNPPKRVICYPDDILFARTGATGEIVTNQLGVFHNNFFKIDYNHKKISKQFLIYYLQNPLITQYFNLMAGTTTIPDLNHDEFLDAPLILPSLIDQKSIIQFLNRELELHKNCKNRVDHSIFFLREYRTSLISAAVTGKIDVRQEVSA